VGLARDRVIPRRQNLLAAKRQVGRVVDLAKAPVIDLSEYLGHWAELRRIAIQSPMQNIGTEGVSQLLRPFHIGNLQEGVVLREVVEPLTVERSRQGPTVCRRDRPVSDQ